MAAQCGGEKMTEGHDNFSAMQSRTAERRRLRLGKEARGSFLRLRLFLSFFPALLVEWDHHASFSSLDIIMSSPRSSAHNSPGRPAGGKGGGDPERTREARRRTDGAKCFKKMGGKKIPENNIWDELRLLGKKCMCGFNKIMQQIELFRCCFNPRALT